MIVMWPLRVAALALGASAPRRRRPSCLRASCREGEPGSLWWGFLPGRGVSPDRRVNDGSRVGDVVVMGATWRQAQTDEQWVDLAQAARYAEVDRVDLQVAVDTRRLSATTFHPRRKGVWMVRLVDVDRWLVHRSRATP